MNSLLLFSGGIESTAIAFWKRPDLLLHIDYGHLPAQGEIRAARTIATRLQLPLKEARIDCSATGSGELSGRAHALCAPATSWWPFRNQLLITLGAAVAVNLGIEILLIGSVASDRLYADSTPEFLEAMRNTIRLQEGGVTLVAPAIHLTTSQLVQESQVPRSLLARTHSCHVSNVACGQCRGCLHHYQTAREACI